MEEDYKELFSELFKMSPITDVQNSFQYEFTDSTKK